MRRKFIILVWLIAAIQYNLLWAYHGDVHKKIDEYAVMPGISQLDSVLKNQLGFTDGIETKFKKQKKDQKIWKWIAFGGEQRIMDGLLIIIGWPLVALTTFMIL